jgi:uncharacterized protein GlcG (DUF336 family)
MLRAILRAGARRSRSSTAINNPEGVRRVRLVLDRLEDRAPVASLIAGGSTVLAGGVLTYNGTAGNDHVMIRFENGLITVTDQSGTLGRFAPGAVTNIVVNAGAGNDNVRIASNVNQPATINGGDGNDVLSAGGGPTTINGGPGMNLLAGGTGPSVLNGGPGNEVFFAGIGPTTVNPGGGNDKVFGVKPGDNVALTLTTRVQANNPRPTAPGGPSPQLLTTGEVESLLRRAAGATSSDDGIVAIVDRNGRILGVRVEGGVSPAITSNPALLRFAIDGAVAEARTGAFFGNDQAPLTSRTIRNLSQSTITQREVESNPNITDINSTQRGPGFVAPVGVGAHFPPSVPNTPEVDLFAIEHTNRDGPFSPGPDQVIGTADDLPLRRSPAPATIPSDQTGRFNIDPAFVPNGQGLYTPLSYGAAIGVAPKEQSRGIGTLPGGIPIYKYNDEVGGIGVFFPGTTGYADEENSQLSTTFNPSKPDRSLEAEYIAYAAVGGARNAGYPKEGPIAGVPLPAGFGLPAGRIDLVGITLDVFGPGGNRGPRNLNTLGEQFKPGNPNSGSDQAVAPGGVLLLPGLQVPSGWLVIPHDGVGITAGEVNQIIQDGLLQANRTRAAIRVPYSSGVKMVFAVSDLNGNIVGLYRMPDATVFSIDVAVAKSRNVAYYANPTQLQPADQVPGVPPGTAFTNRTIRYLSLPRFPSSVDGTAPGPFSILRDGGSNPLTALQQGPRKPAYAFQSVLGHDAFFPGTNFHDPYNLKNQDGIVFFPGSAPLYGAGQTLIGGFGVSGDGVDQDDVVTSAGAEPYMPVTVPRADQTFYAGVRLPYQKYNRNPEAF